MLLFRQAVLAALPHLHQQPNNLLAKGKIAVSAAPSSVANHPSAAAAAAITGGQSWTRRKQQHLQQQQQQQQLTGGGGYRSLQDGSSDQPTASAIIASSSSNNPVVDSGFSTEASNSNTSPRSSRFDTTSSSEMTMSHHSGQQQPMEKELLQHLERVQQRLARLRKDEDRLQTLLNLKRMANGNLAATTASSGEDDGDELWHLLEEIQLRSQAIRNSSNDVSAKDAVNKPEEAIQQQQQQQPMSHKKRVSFQQQLLETEGGGVIASVDALPSPAGKSSTGPVGSSSSAVSSGSSSSSSRYQPPSRDQVATILRLTNPVQLQRHLLRALLDNQVKIISAFLLLLFFSFVGCKQQKCPIRAMCVDSFLFFFFTEDIAGASGKWEMRRRVTRRPMANQEPSGRRADDGLARRKRGFAVPGKKDKFRRHLAAENSFSPFCFCLFVFLCESWKSRKSSWKGRRRDCGCSTAFLRRLPPTPSSTESTEGRP